MAAPLRQGTFSVDVVVARGGGEAKSDESRRQDSVLEGVPRRLQVHAEQEVYTQRCLQQVWPRADSHQSPQSPEIHKKEAKVNPWPP